MSRIKIKNQKLQGDARAGIVSIITVMIIALFLFAAGILAGVESNTAIFSGFSSRQANRAQFLAESGIEDAIIRIARNGSFTGTYTISDANGTSTVTVTAGSPIIINATGTVGTGQDIIMRAIQASVVLGSDGKILSVTKSDQ